MNAKKIAIRTATGIGVGLACAAFVLFVIANPPEGSKLWWQAPLGMSILCIIVSLRGGFFWQNND